jgi:hypothetical protein
MYGNRQFRNEKQTAKKVLVLFVNRNLPEGSVRQILRLLLML